MGKRARRRNRGESKAAPLSTTDYTDPEGNVLTLRDELSAGTREKVRQLDSTPGASGEDLWQRREELLFERLAVTWTIAGLPLEGQRELLGRYRMADSETRSWVHRTIDRHLDEKQPEALP
jgi:hypothetical protein